MKKSRLTNQLLADWSALGEPLPGLVVAVSGGADSVALLNGLLEVCSESTPLVVAHLNHRLRGVESDADEAFVRELVADHLSFTCRRLEVRALAQGENLEAVARRERYRWLAEVAHSHGLRFVVTGHNANDQAETVLHRLLRGTGLEGLRGIAARRPLQDGIEVVRPLLSVTREEIVAYLNERGKVWRHDSSNDDTKFTRNRLRHELLPLLQRDYNPRVVEVLGRLAFQADEAFREEEQETIALLAQVELRRAGGMIVLDAVKLASYTRRQVRHVIRHVWRREGWPMGRMTFADYDRVAALVEIEQGAHDLPQGVKARRMGKVLQLMV